MKGIFRSDKGRVRAHNEDNGFFSGTENSTVLAAVADGMGGHQAGDVASGIAIEHVKKAWQNRPEELRAKNCGEWLKETIQGANEAIIRTSLDQPQYGGMGTTLIAAAAEESDVTIANAGDSRMYYYSASQADLRLVTSDHSVPGEMVKKGHITQEEAEVHPQKNILTNALGTDWQINVDLEQMIWDAGDIILLCSDGLSDKLGLEDIQKLLAEETPIEKKADEMVKLANARGGEDNITVLMLENRPKGGAGND
ncbi:Stp1/IreP family PP2C-type Ser/Thr phosphatase [Salisediminibacterium halotolerans]|uniref:Serine/threonine protein phosphatase PrpC n=1 Tax=Salisediminibacterium halotolerans TaxID=517425 RepID=A0A1H9PZ77_9BACI|nr:Stp1/IreP family PP2C-type Ser/Thr phosphatase [Salisediminibacterium haloalkalitolerans]SER53049.1 Serine/threonine protein phosphatase PrpC [Salisediminibacterium haloalkalitolerans]